MPSMLAAPWPLPVLSRYNAWTDMFALSVRVAEWLRPPPLIQDQSDREGPGSNPGAGKLDSGFRFGWKYEYQRKLGLKWGHRFTSIEVDTIGAQTNAV